MMNDKKNFYSPGRTIARLKSGGLITIAAIGDSLTFGWMASKGYLDFLKEMLSAKYPKAALDMVNRGIPGDTAEWGLHRLESDIISVKPDCVIVQFALNDAYSGYTPERFGDLIRLMVDRISNSSEADIVLVTSVWILNQAENRMAEEFYNQLETIAAERSLPIARVHAYWKRQIDLGIDAGRLVQGDLVHPTAEGYKVMAEAIMEIFEEAK